MNFWYKKQNSEEKYKSRVYRNIIYPVNTQVSRLFSSQLPLHTECYVLLYAVNIVSTVYDYMLYSSTCLLLISHSLISTGIHDRQIFLMGILYVERGLYNEPRLNFFERMSIYVIPI